jgi:hypothetical protein
MNARAARQVDLPVFAGGEYPVAHAAVKVHMFAFAFFMLVNTQSQPLILLALVLAIAAGMTAMFGPQAAYFGELFGARLRYSGFAFARELDFILAGGPVPFVAAPCCSGPAASRGRWPATGFVPALITAVSVYR